MLQPKDLIPDLEKGDRTMEMLTYEEPADIDWRMASQTLRLVDYQSSRDQAMMQQRWSFSTSGTSGTTFGLGSLLGG